ncbi:MULTISPECIES: flagellar hook protein FlgE [unclassified Modestobacter]
MLRSMFSAISGLKAHQTKLDVAGNNIANVNTVGFKSSQTVFQDTLSQIVRNGAAPNGDVAGSNPAAVGLGVKVAGITTNWTQGSAQSTGRSSDFMITGDGFFITKSGNENLYTRAGSFDTDAVGNLVTPDGLVLQGWMADGTGTVDPNGPLESLRIPQGKVLAPVPTTSATIQGNLSAGAVVGGTPVTSQITMYDDLGNAHQMSVSLQKLADNQWELTLAETKDGVTTSWPPQTLDFGDTAPETGKLEVGGAVTTDPDTGAPVVTFSPGGATPAYPSWAEDFTLDLSGLTQFGGASTAAGKSNELTGSALGTLESYSLSNDGTIVGLYSNGLRQPLGQLALASFVNPGGLEKAGNSSFRAGDNSGNPVVGQAGTGGRGQLSAGSLEMSNVDLAEEFTGLIVAQRGFQANSRVISTSDEILQDLVQLKR